MRDNPSIRDLLNELEESERRQAHLISVMRDLDLDKRRLEKSVRWAADELARFAFDMMPDVMDEEPVNEPD